MPYNANQNELKMLKFWEEKKIFEKSVQMRDENKPYVFYDGPPFATGLPHYGHILSSVIKDVVPRYATMKGYRVRRRWGWDCHGLPIEQLIEKELKISGKKQIETEFGIDKFNEACESKVLMYTKEWKKMVDREGRWVEFDNAYKTMDPTYMESVWWALKTIWDKGKIYEGRKVLMYCPRCETPVSKAEIAMDNSYKDITEETATAKFKVKRNKEQKTSVLDVDGPVFVLAWTTTPWTLPGNVALAVGADIVYALVKKNNEHYIVAQDLVEKIMKSEYEVVSTLLGSELVGLEYEPLFNMPAMLESGKKAYYVTSADFVTIAEGTGVVHTAVIYGEDDYNLGVKIDLPMVPMLDEGGMFTDVVPENFRGQYFKKAEKEIKRDLEERGLLFSKEQFTHSYPHCWRCDTQLFYNAISAWFIDIQSVKQRMIELNQKVSWHPEHLKDGRFLNILETAPDWNISRNRYWATPLPFWKCDGEECKNVVCVGSVKELKEKSINFVEVYTTDTVSEMDLHKQHADKIKLQCEKCSGTMTRIPEVIDCWVESGSMPFAEFHYPFENTEVFEKRFPGQFIAEYIAQTRAWFYYMHAMSVLLFDNVGFENVVCTGTILNEKGEKLSKSKQNYTDPWIIIEQYGMDALRYYLMTSVVMQSENLLFNDREVKDVYNKVINMLSNVVLFYEMYADQLVVQDTISENVLDRWILAKLQVLVKEVTENMDKYNTVHAARPIKDFIDELSTWYLRRSRDRFKDENEADKQNALRTLREVLLTLSKVMAPFTPFIAEKIYKDVGGVVESVHLALWPEVDEKKMDSAILEQMNVARKIVEMGLSLRAEAGIKVRQPLQKFQISNFQFQMDGLAEIIADEMNVKEVLFETALSGKNIVVKEEGNLQVALHIEITDSLKKEGYVRELVRTINQRRKEMNLTVKDVVVVEYATDDKMLQGVFEEYNDELKKSVLATELRQGNGEKEFEVDGKKVKLTVQKI